MPGKRFSLAPASGNNAWTPDTVHISLFSWEEWTRGYERSDFHFRACLPCIVQDGPALGSLLLLYLLWRDLAFLLNQERDIYGLISLSTMCIN
jgi:hypothetical protein